MNPVWKMHHESVQAFCEAPAGGTNMQIFQQYAIRHIEQEDEWMFGDAKNLAGLQRRMREGWHEGAEKILQLQGGELAAPLSAKRRHKRADQGDSLDIHAVYRGDLSHAWERTVRTNRRSPATIRIVPMIAGSCAQRSEQFFYRGAAVAKLCDMLTEAGYNCEIVAACVAEQVTDGVDYSHSITLKPANAPLDLASLASVLCQQGFVRYYMFRSFVGIKGLLRSAMGYYGDRKLLDDLGRRVVDEDNVKTIFMRYSVDTAQAAQQWIADSIAEIERHDD